MTPSLSAALVDAEVVHDRTAIREAVEAIADDVIIIARGKVLAQGTLEEVRKGHESLEDAFFALTDGLAQYRSEAHDNKGGETAR